MVGDLISVKDLKQKLLESVGDELAVFGFSRKPKGQSFYRSFEEGWTSVHLAFIDHNKSFDTTMDIAVRFNRVEELVNAKNTLLTEKEKRATATLGVEIGNLSLGQQKRWTVSSKKDLVIVTRSILKAYREYGEPYLRKYSDLQIAFEALSNNNEESWMHNPIHSSRARRTIALASILGYADLQDIIATQKEFLESSEDFGLKSFLDFVADL